MCILIRHQGIIAGTVMPPAPAGAKNLTAQETWEVQEILAILALMDIYFWVVDFTKNILVQLRTQKLLREPSRNVLVLNRQRYCQL